MNNRSTNARYVHFGGDVIAGVESSHGVQITGGSTGGSINAFGDDTDISLNILPKGAGPLVLGNSSNAVLIGGSSRTFKGVFSQDSTYSHAAIPVDRQAVLTFASTTVDINPGDHLTVGLTVATADQSSVVGIAWWRLSTAATSRLTVSIFNQASTATSTGSGTLHLSWLDLS